MAPKQPSKASTIEPVHSQLRIPDVKCLIVVKAPGATPVTVNLDDYDNPEDVTSLITQAIEKYGAENVRYAKVVQIKTETKISLDL